MSVLGSTVTVMSQDTEQALARARAIEQSAADDAQDRIEALLNALAGGLADQAVAIARRVSQAQPNVATTIGREGITALRDELTAAAQSLAADVETHPEMFTWPSAQSEFSAVTANDVRSAIFKAWYGRRVDALGNVIEKYGFDVHRDNRERRQGVVLPQYLYTQEVEEAHFGAVAEALTALGAAQRAVSRAQAALDREAVDSLWD